MIPPSDFPEVNKTGSVKNNSMKSDNQHKVSDKAKALRESIANGTYKMNTKAIAERMVQSGILKD